MRRALLLLALVGCDPVAPSGTTDCEQACQHLRQMRCPSAEPTPDGATCETFLCEAHGVKARCIVRASSCDEAELLQTRGCAR